MSEAELEAMAEKAIAALQSAGIWMHSVDHYERLEAMMNFLEEHGPQEDQSDA